MSNGLSILLYIYFNNILRYNTGSFIIKIAYTSYILNIPKYVKFHQKSVNLQLNPLDLSHIVEVCEHSSFFNYWRNCLLNSGIQLGCPKFKHR